MTHNENYLLGVEPVLISNNNCVICGLVVWNTELHLNYSHPKKKKPCQSCGQSGTGRIDVTGIEGLYTVTKCENCNGIGYYELEERI